MSLARKQIQIDAPVAEVWKMVADVERHPQWWPRVIDVECEGVEQGCTYRRVFKRPFGGVDDTTIMIDEFDQCRSLKIRCLDTGSFCAMTLAESRGGTFVDAQAGLEPKTSTMSVLDRLGGKRFYSRWLDESLDALRDSVCARQPVTESADV